MQAVSSFERSQGETRSTNDDETAGRPVKKAEKNPLVRFNLDQNQLKPKVMIFEPIFQSNLLSNQSSKFK